MKTITFLMLLLFSLKGFSCDHCNIYLNVTPNDNKHSIGIYYRHRQMMGMYNNFGQQLMTRHASHGNDPGFWGNTVSERYRAYELRGTFRIGQRFRTYIVLPFVQNSQYINDDLRLTVSGIGDPVAIGSIQVNDPTQVSKNENFRHRFEIGAGIKAPLGRINKVVNEQTPNLDLQPGSGSWDAIIMMKYIMKIKFFGIMANINYKVNSKNKNDYKYGNTFNGTLNLFFQTQFKDFTFMPLIGFNVEQAAYDSSIIEHTDTGGTTGFGNIGLQLFWKDFQLFGEFQKAAFNKLNGYNQLINKYKINAGLIYNF